MTLAGTWGTGGIGAGSLSGPDVVDMDELRSGYVSSPDADPVRARGTEGSGGDIGCVRCEGMADRSAVPLVGGTNGSSSGTTVARNK